jgi:hypothetical protein
MDKAASTQPPPATHFLPSSTRFTTHKASWTERSISSQYMSLGPRRMMDAAVLFIRKEEKKVNKKARI